MPGVLLQESGFSLDNSGTIPIPNAFYSPNSTLYSVLQDENILAASSPPPSDISSTSSNLTTCFDASSSVPRTLPFTHTYSSTLVRGATANALGSRSWSPPSIDVNNGDEVIALQQDYETLWSNIVDNGADASKISRCNTGIMLGSFFCDLKDVTGSSFSTEGSPSGSPTSPTVASPLSKYFLSSNGDCVSADYVYASDEFRMFEFKVRRCTRGRSHDWTECPFAHPGEKARRRDPRRFHYSGISCPDFRKGNCKRGDACEFAHGVFECWLHPARYRTQPCKDGRSCTRRVCFFAHTPEQLRHLPAAAHSPATSALITNGSCDLHSYSELYQTASILSSNCSNEDTFDENMAYGMLGCTGSFDGSRYLTGGSPRARQSCCMASRITSPTSTLACIAHSPSHLSPPHSPSSPHSWHGALSPALPVAACTARGLLPHSSFLSSRTSFPRVQALLAAAQNDGSSFTHGIQFSAPPSSFPSYTHANLYKSFTSAPASPCGTSHSLSRKSVSDLAVAVQQLDLRGTNQIWLQHSSSPHASAPSPLGRSSNASSDNNDAWSIDVMEEGENKSQRVEYGKILRAKIYGKAVEAETSMNQDESPDLGWVNDLV